MKHCPVCDERFDEDIIKFCTKDGTPLVDDVQPSFTAMPSENLEEPDDDFGQETIIRRKSDLIPPASELPGAERIVIPTGSPAEQQVRQRTAAAYYPPPQPPNTAKTVVLTILGTLFVLACGAGLFWFLQRDSKPVTNINTNGNFANQSTNLNTNLGFDGNFNFNTNSSFNSNFNLSTNLNANVKSPTPSPKPSPSVSPTPQSSPTPTPTPRPTPNSNSRPSPTPTPRTGPRPPALTNTPATNHN